MTYNTVVSGTTITATWGNQVRDQQLSVFTNAAARDSAITVPLAGMSCYTSTDDQFWRYTTKWLRMQKTVAFDASALQSYTTTGFVDVPGFTFSADANSVFSTDVWISTVAPTANDLQFQWVIPASATIERGLLSPASGNGGGSVDTTIFQGTAATAGGFTVGGMASSGAAARDTAVIKTLGTAGTCKLQAAQLVAGGTSFIRAGRFVFEQTA